MTELDPRELRTALGSFMTGVTVVTALSDDGQPVGFTANSFTSVSLDPPLLLVCPGSHLSSFDIFAKATHFAVNILAEGQEETSNIFAGSKGDRFSKISWQSDENGSPLLEGAAAQFSCSRHQAIDAGDHIILVGRIETFTNSNQPGLGYCRDGYFSLGQERRSEVPATRDTKIVASVLLEHDGQLGVLRQADGHCLPCIEVENRSGARSAIRRHLSELSIEAELGPVYSVFDDADSATHITVFRARLNTPSRVTGLEFWPIQSAALAELPLPANPAMMRRYQLEHSNGHFGLYIGDAERGEVHHPNPITA